MILKTISSVNVWRRRKSPATPRKGNVLIMFALLAFAMMGLAALVIDMGIARLTQQQMQSAVDSAALDGLRWRDQVADSLLIANTGIQQQLMAAGYSSPPSTPYAANDSSWQTWLMGARSLVQGNATVREQIRRQLASDAVALAFDDNLDPTDGDLFQYGAGPIVRLTGGIGDPSLAGSQLMSLAAAPSARVYKPVRSDGTPGLELNSDDAAEGDMVQGTFGINSAFETNNSGSLSDEVGDYERRDFTPGSGGATSDSYLVRMRRTNDFLGLDNVPGVSSSGPSLPFLFGRGSLMTKDSDPLLNPQGYSPRRDGMSVRATAIASVGSAPLSSTGPTARVGNVLVAGPTFPAGTFGNGGLSGAVTGTVPFAVNSSNWPVTSGIYNVDTSGNLVLNGGSGTVVAVLIGVTSLVDELDESGTTVHVTVAEGFPNPSHGPFTVLVDQELILVTAAMTLSDGSVTWTVERGAWHSQRQTHSSGNPIVASSTTGIGDAVILPHSGSAVYLRQAGSRPTSLGNLASLQAHPATPAIPTSAAFGYVPIVCSGSTADPAYGRIIGFGLIQWQVTQWTSVSGYQIQLTRPTINTVAPENATATLSRPFSVDVLQASNSAAIVRSLMNNNLMMNSPLITPVLVNRQLGPNFK